MDFTLWRNLISLVKKSLSFLCPQAALSIALVECDSPAKKIVIETVRQVLNGPDNHVHL